MSSSRVIKLPVADTDGVAVLIYVTAKKRDEFDLDLLATDGDSAFKGKVRERNLVKLRANNYDGADGEWKAILTHTFSSKEPEGLSDTVRQNLDISCSQTGKDPKTVLTINFRSRVEDITQRLGAIELSQTQDVDGVDLFGWASQLVDERDGLQNAWQKEKAAASSADQTIASLQAQLADLVKGKVEHEQDLMARFAALLNEKKKELRRRARQLSTAKVDPKKLEQFEEEQGLQPKQPGSRRKKRGAQELQDDSESEALEDRMDVDKGDNQGEEEQPRDSSRSTSRASDDESDGDGDLDQPVASQANPEAVASTRELQEIQESEPMPPRRDLTFTRKSKAEQKISSPKPQTPEDDETASEDDEL